MTGNIEVQATGNRKTAGITRLLASVKWNFSDLWKWLKYFLNLPTATFIPFVTTKKKFIEVYIEYIVYFFTTTLAERLFDWRCIDCIALFECVYNIYLILGLVWCSKTGMIDVKTYSGTSRPVSSSFSNVESVSRGSRDFFMRLHSSVIRCSCN